MGRYIVRYMVGNLVLQRHASEAKKVIFDHISDDIPPQKKILKMVIPILVHICSFVSKLYKAAIHPRKCDIINDIFCIFRNMPDIDTLMQEWPPEFEDLLKEVG